MEIGLSNPFNYTGGKHRYLKEMKEILPDVKHLEVIDMFFGGGDLSTHLPKSWDVDAYEINTQLLKMHSAIKKRDLDYIDVEMLIERAELSKTNEKAYDRLKAVYNWDKDDVVMLYTLICHSNTNRLRFNKKGEFNVQFGKRTFNPSMKKKLIDYSNRLQERDIWFYNKSSLLVDLNEYGLILVDPPYLNTTACYNEGGGWTVDMEKELHRKLHEASDNGKKFIYFGQTISNGTINPYLTEFAEKYNVKVLKKTTEACSSNRKYKGETIECMIWN